MKIIKLNELEKEEEKLKDLVSLSDKQKQRLREIAVEKIPLISFLDEAKLQRKRIKEEIGNLFFILLFISRQSEE